MLKRQLKAEMLALYAINVRLVNTDCKNYQLMIKTSCIVLVLIMAFIYFIYKFENDVQLFFFAHLVILTGIQFWVMSPLRFRHLL